MNDQELFDLIARALSQVDVDPESETGKRVYLAYLASRVGQGATGPMDRRLAQLSEELGLQ